MNFKFNGFFLLSISFSFILYQVYLEYDNENDAYNENFQHSKAIDEEFFVFKGLNLNIINKHAVQYSVEINGEKYPKHVPLHQNKSINFELLNNNKISSTKLILFWNRWWGDQIYVPTESQNQFKKNNCPVTNCRISNNMSDLNNADLVIVHAIGPYSPIPVKNRSQSSPRWVLAWYEPPSRNSLNLNDFKDVFNLTATYHINSSFPGFYESYSQIIWEKNDEFNESEDFTIFKTNMAAAVISDSGSHVTSNRIKFINELKKYIDVDVFGQLGKRCPTKFKNPNLKPSKYLNELSFDGLCKDIIYQEYKFYFAFENGICNEYITEKFFLTLYRPIIPVVIGAGPYDYYVPKSGYINALDFDTPKSLADYLLYLDKNKTAYNEYFKWKKHVKHVEKLTGLSPLCDMCIKLHLESFFGIEKSQVNDMSFLTRETCKKTAPTDKKFFNLINL